MLALELSLQLLLLIGLGLFAQKRGIVKGDFDQQLSSFVLDLALPCLIVKSMSVPYSPEELRNSLTLLVLSAGVLALQLALGQGCYLLSGRSGSGRILRFGVAFTNFTFVGMPVVEALYGQKGLFYFVIFLVPMRMVYYSSAKPLLSPPGMAHEERTALQTLKGWLSPPVAAVGVGLLLYLTGIQLPGVVSGVIASVGSICSPLGMILCGISLGKYDFKRLLRPAYLKLPLLRNVAMPALFYGLTRLLPIDPLLGDIVVIFTALPVASLLAAFTIQYEPDPALRFESAGSVMLSTLLSAVTIPLWAAVLGMG